MAAGQLSREAVAVGIIVVPYHYNTGEDNRLFAGYRHRIAADTQHLHCSCYYSYFLADSNKLHWCRNIH